MKVAIVKSLLFKLSPTSSISVAIASTVDSLGRNLNCFWVRRSCLTKCFIRLACTKRLRTLPGRGRREIGGRSVTLVGCLVLGMEITVATYAMNYAWGNTHVGKKSEFREKNAHCILEDSAADTVNSTRFKNINFVHLLSNSFSLICDRENGVAEDALLLSLKSPPFGVGKVVDTGFIPSWEQRVISLHLGNYLVKLETNVEKKSLIWLGISSTLMGILFKSCNVILLSDFFSCLGVCQFPPIY